VDPPRLLVVRAEPVAANGIPTELTQLETTEDFKTRLQEFLQKRFQKSPRYSVIQETGPDHQKMFEVQIEFYGKTLGQGRGRSKREAEQAAARVAYMELSIENLEKIEAKAKRVAHLDLKKKNKVKAQSAK
jgi:dsRNA-specific ribonuclease